MEEQIQFVATSKGNFRSTRNMMATHAAFGAFVGILSWVITHQVSKIVVDNVNYELNNFTLTPKQES